MSDLPYPENEGHTHWDECWKERGHHNCAVAKVERLTRENEELREGKDGKQELACEPAAPSAPMSDRERELVEAAQMVLGHRCSRGARFEDDYGFKALQKAIAKYD